MSAPVTRIETFTLLSKKLRKPNSPVTKNVAVSNFAYKIEVFIPNTHQPLNEDGTPIRTPSSSRSTAPRSSARCVACAPSCRTRAGCTPT
ncbi:hypothetical protein STCU_10966 [Strigomonas culicis]|uniref:Uncharacterized protein n=1 Tax=Strigomonas culicis TaxID=28005 RepID=S9TKF5_9TRYP|nr:hypothetical protein STCU_10966 [Strigomonas culicis]|eukprot:EPY16828.1 hypothetical protein STCU_10966 [Strigomonas culicis]